MSGNFEVCSIDDIIEIIPSITFKKENTQANKDNKGSDFIETERFCPIDIEIKLIRQCNEYSYVCPKCAYMEVLEDNLSCNIQTGDGHNVSNNSYMSFKPTGIKNRIYQNTMIKYTSEKNVYRDTQIHELLKKYNFINNDLTIPQNILESAAQMFITLKNSQESYVKRGKSRRGVLGAAIYFECLRAGITKTKSQIAKMMKVDESDITHGENELKYYASIGGGIIDIPENVNPFSDYFNTYFEIFNIPVDKYKDFAMDLLETMIAKNVTEVLSCHNNTKCIGVVYFIGKHFKLPDISHENISKNCNGITRSTYLNIYNAIIKYINKSSIAIIFKKYGFSTTHKD